MDARTASGEATALPPKNKKRVKQEMGETVDLVARHQAAMADMLANFGDELLDLVRDSKRVDVDDVRKAVIGPMRRAAQLD